LRKIFELGTQLASLLSIGGWRQHKHLYKKVKKLSRHIERIAARKGAQYRERLQEAYQELLQLSGMLIARASELRDRARETAAAARALGAELEVFLERTQQVCHTARRRVLEGENVPNRDKLFSIFEPHTQLYKRGKAGEPVQFGRLALVFEDAAGFVCHYHLLPREAEDREVVVEQTRALQARLGGRVRQISFDRGFHSPANQRELAEIVAHPCLPMPGSKQAQRQEEQAGVEFRQARQRHPGIESAIGALQSGNGLKRCRDRTEPGYARYLGLGILGRNLHVLGKLLIARAASGCKAAGSLRGRTAA